jgi:hypothetical protein
VRPHHIEDKLNALFGIAGLPRISLISTGGGLLPEEPGDFTASLAALPGRLADPARRREAAMVLIQALAFFSDDAAVRTAINRAVNIFSRPVRRDVLVEHLLPMLDKQKQLKFFSVMRRDRYFAKRSIAQCWALKYEVRPKLQDQISRLRSPQEFGDKLETVSAFPPHSQIAVDLLTELVSRRASLHDDCRPAEFAATIKLLQTFLPKDQARVFAELPKIIYKLPKKYMGAASKIVLGSSEKVPDKCRASLLGKIIEKIAFLPSRDQSEISGIIMKAILKLPPEHRVEPLSALIEQGRCQVDVCCKLVSDFSDDDRVKVLTALIKSMQLLSDEASIILDTVGAEMSRLSNYYRYRLLAAVIGRIRFSLPEDVQNRICDAVGSLIQCLAAGDQAKAFFELLKRISCLPPSRSPGAFLTAAKMIPALAAEAQARVFTELGNPHGSMDEAAKDGLSEALKTIQDKPQEPDTSG